MIQEEKENTNCTIPVKEIKFKNLSRNLKESMDKVQ